MIQIANSRMRNPDPKNLYRMNRTEIDRRNRMWRQQTPSCYLHFLIFYLTSTWLELMESFHIIFLSLVVLFPSSRPSSFFYSTLYPCMHIQHWIAVCNVSFSHHHTNKQGKETVENSTEIPSSHPLIIILQQCSFLLSSIQILIEFIHHNSNNNNNNNNKRQYIKIISTKLKQTELNFSVF